MITEYVAKLKLDPRKDQLMGRTVILKPTGKIEAVDPAKATKFVIVDAVGPDATAGDIKPGDVILPQAMGGIVMDGGLLFRPYVEAKSVAFVVREVTLDDLLVQTENGKDFVPFGSPKAAQSLAVKEKTPDAQSDAA